jgi:carbonic anhydrase
MDKNINSLIQGHFDFQNVKFKQNEQRFKDLVENGQSPKALFIGCSDSRVVPDVITGSLPGDLFVTRNIGNLVPPFKPDEEYHATAAVIEYAVTHLKVSDVIVCGHSHCGAISSLYKEIPKDSKNIHINKWLDLAEPAKKIAMMSHRQASLEDRLRYTEKISVLFQLQNLMSYPAVKEAVEAGELFIHAWYFDIETGEIECFDDDEYEYKLLSEKDK